MWPTFHIFPDPPSHQARHEAEHSLVSAKGVFAAKKTESAGIGARVAKSQKELDAMQVRTRGVSVSASASARVWVGNVKQKIISRKIYLCACDDSLQNIGDISLPDLRLTLAGVYREF